MNQIHIVKIIVKMCRECNASPALTYARMYNEAFLKSNKSEWISQQIKYANTLCMVHEAKILRYIKTAAESQTCFENVRSSSLKMIASGFDRASKVRKIRLKRLQTRMLKYSYRPNGNMFRRTQESFKNISKKCDGI